MATPPVAVVVEDEHRIRRSLRSALERAQWQVFDAWTLADGMAACRSRHPQLVLLDLGLPDGDGKNLIRAFREWSDAPLIVLSARSSEEEKVEALTAGADDYLTKPFGIGELIARVAVVTRRHDRTTTDVVVKFGEIEVDLDSRIVRRAGREVHLTPTEYHLLTNLISHAGKVLTHRQLLREVWGPEHIENHHYLRVYMGNLRAKLEDEPAQPRHLLTVTAVGYRLLLEAAPDGGPAAH